MIEMAKEIESMHIKLSSKDDDGIKPNLQQQMHQLEEKLITMSHTRQFKMTPHTKSVTVKDKPHHMATTQMDFKCRMNQFPVNLKNATNGSKPHECVSRWRIVITSL